MVENAYFMRRAEEELLAAEIATSPEAALAHRELARRFSMRVEASGPVNEELDSSQSA